MSELKTLLADNTEVDNINAAGNVTGLKVGVFAYLTGSAATETTVAGTYYPIEGTFVNSPIECFRAAVTHTPGIKYDCALTQYFEIDWHATVSAEVANTTFHCAIYKNGALVTSSRMGTFAKNAGQPYAVSGTVVLELDENDEIQLMTQSDQAEKDLTFLHYSTTISEFFD